MADPKSATSGVTHESRIGRASGLVTANVDGEVVMMSLEESRYFGLDDIGTDIWRRLEQGCSLAELVDGLARDYDGDRGTIEKDVTALIQKMAAHKLVTLS